jgi:hypothetical protein
MVVGCVLAMSGPATAGIMDSADFPWKYEMNVLPTAEDLEPNGVMDFDLYQSGSGSVSEGILTMTNGTKSLNYWCPDGDELWPLDADITYANGYTFEVKLKIVSSVTNGFAWIVNAEDGGGPSAWLNVKAAGQSWKSTVESLGDQLDNTDDFHVFRVAQAPGAATYSVWRDGLLLSDTLGEGFSGAGNSLTWDDVGGGWGGTMEVDYLRFTDGAYAPIPEPGTLALLVGALLSLLVWRRR